MYMHSLYWDNCFLQDRFWVTFPYNDGDNYITNNVINTMQTKLYYYSAYDIKDTEIVRIILQNIYNIA
jgi:hypothetical protein